MNEKRYHAEDQVNFVGLKNLVYAFLQEFYRFVAFTQVVIRKKIFRVQATFVSSLMSSLDINDYANMIVKVFENLHFGNISA